MVSTVVGRCVRVWKRTKRWVIDPNRHERRLVTLVARLAGDNKSFLDFYVFPNMGGRRKCVSLDDPWLDRGRPLHDLREFCTVARNARAGHGGAPGLFESRTH